MDTFDESDRPILKAFGELPTWQKAAMVVTGVMLAPMALFVGVITGLSVFPLFLFGRFEGSAKRGTLEHDVEDAARKQQKRTEEYYAST